MIRPRAAYTVSRREFVGLIGAAGAWPFSARAQQPPVPVVGYLYLGAVEASGPLLEAFQKGLSEMGYVEGRNVAIEFRWARNEIHRLQELAADLVHRQVSVIATPGSQAAALAAKAATTTIPIVFNIGGGPVSGALPPKPHRPGGN